MRLAKAKKRVQDPDLDKWTNPHDVKHWMDPKLIPFGWGLFKEDIIPFASSIVFKEGQTGGTRLGERGERGYVFDYSEVTTMIILWYILQSNMIYYVSRPPMMTKN